MHAHIIQLWILFLVHAITSEQSVWMLVIAAIILYAFVYIHFTTKILLLTNYHEPPYSSKEFCTQYWSIVHGFNLFCVSSFMRGHVWSEPCLKCFYSVTSSSKPSCKICTLSVKRLTSSHQPSASSGCDIWAFSQNQWL